MGTILSNSGDLLKLLVPNYVWKYISGWSNYSDKVTSQKMIERKMEYRGSKSRLELYKRKSSIVKEQRVDGSRHNHTNRKCLRYTLMGFERNYQLRIPSKQLM